MWKCAETCPKALIDLVPETRKQEYSAALKNSVKNVMSVCKAGCIGCKHAKKYVNLERSKLKTTSHRSIMIKCVGCGLCAGKMSKRNHYRKEISS